ncbi:HAD family hydrolase [Treponema zioleckii]|uniref:HAD family hydrolase n=1 Tax=Treponema zioleckii TaxID=331680 RepID=UPI00168AA3BD|nr:HAD family hydrolase [Treponema zioleckii]
MFDYLFFDLDGTLTNPAKGIANSFVYALKYYGIEIPSYEKLCSFIGPPLLDTFRTQFGFSDEKAAEAIVKYREYFAEKGLFENSVYPGIKNLLEKLKSAEKKLVVATSKPEEYSVRIIEHFGLAEYFENVCGSNIDETRSKKDEVIEYAIARNGITDRSKILMIGDRKHDILGAKKTGLKSCGVLFGYGTREELKTAGADFIAESLAELEKICLQ